MKHLKFGVDVGATNTRVASYSEGQEAGRREFTTTLEFDPTAAAIVSAIQAIEREVAGSAVELGIGVAGKVDPMRQTLIGSGNLGKWVNQPIAQTLSQSLGIRVVLGNDAETSALGDAIYGDLPANQDFWGMIWGSGVGGCLIRWENGKPKTYPGEPGHQVVRPGSGLRCNCGQLDCLEALVGGKKLPARFGKPGERLEGEEWLEVLTDLATGIRNIVTCQPVPLVVFSGGIAAKQCGLLPQLQTLVVSQMSVVRPPVIRLSKHGETAGTLGCLALLSFDA